MRGASALDEMLDGVPDAPIRVQVVWEPVLKTDVAAPINQVLRLIDDGRVSQYWDPKRIVSADIVRAVNLNPAAYRLEEALPPDFIAWDAIAVFGASRSWQRDLPIPVYYGGPVVDVVEDAHEALLREIGAAARSAPERRHPQ